MLCELGVVVCTLVLLFSLNHHGNGARIDGNAANNRDKMALAFVSLAISLSALVVTLVGVSRTLRAADNAWQIIRSSASGGRLAFGNRQSASAVVVPLHGHGKEELGPPLSYLVAWMCFPLRLNLLF